MTVQMEMVDIQVRPYLDVTLPKVREYLLNKNSTGQYFAVLLSPPCSTFLEQLGRTEKDLDL